MYRVPAHGKQRVGRLPLQPLLHGGHGGVGGKQHQCMALGRFQQRGDLPGKLVIIVAVFQTGRVPGQVQQTVLLVIKWREGDGLRHPAICQQARVLFETPEILAHGHRAGGEDHRPQLPPERLAELGGQVGDGGAEHRAALPIVHGVQHHSIVIPAEQGHRFSEVLHLPAGTACQQVLELAVDYLQLALRRGQQSGVGVEGMPFLRCWYEIFKVQQPHFVAVIKV